MMSATTINKAEVMVGRSIKKTLKKIEVDLSNSIISTNKDKMSVINNDVELGVEEVDEEVEEEEEDSEEEEEEEEEEEDEDEKALKLLQEKIAKKQYAKDADVRKAKVIEKLKERNTDIIKEIGEKIEEQKELLKIHQNKKTDDYLIDGRDIDALYDTMFVKKNKKSAGGGGKRASPTKIVRDLPAIFKDNQVIHHKSGSNIWVAKYDLIKGDIVLISDPNVKKNDTYTKVIKGQGDKNIGEIIQKNTRYTNLNQFICSHNSIYDAPKVQKECAWTGCIWRVDKEGKEIKLK